MKKYDAIIIGFGKGGKTLAADLGSRGMDCRRSGTFERNVRRDMY